MPVQLTLTHAEDVVNVVWYSISVDDNGSHWVVKKRYSQFSELDSALSKTPGYSRTQLPEKGLIGLRKMLNMGGFNEQRQHGLAVYLAHLAQQLQTLSQLPVLQQFLAPPAYLQPSVGQQAVPFAAPASQAAAIVPPPGVVLPAGTAVVAAPGHLQASAPPAFQAMYAGSAPTQAMPAQAVPAQAMPTAQAMPIAQAMPAQAVPAQAMPTAQAMPIAQAMPAQAVPAHAMPAQAVVAQAMPAQAVAAQAMPAQPVVVAQAMPAQAVAAQPVVAQAMPAQPVVAQAMPVQGTPVTPVQALPFQGVPAQAEYPQQQQSTGVGLAQMVGGGMVSGLLGAAVGAMVERQFDHNHTSASGKGYGKGGYPSGTDGYSYGSSSGGGWDSWGNSREPCGGGWDSWGNSSGGGWGREQRCFRCEGRGFCHNSSMPHDKSWSERCFFCEDCTGCESKGYIAREWNTSRCQRCEGHGFWHDSSMPHDKAPHEKCFFCKPCNLCDDSGRAQGWSCQSCGGLGFKHDSPMTHDKAPGSKCFFCKDCKACSGSGRA